MADFARLASPLPAKKPRKKKKTKGSRGRQHMSTFPQLFDSLPKNFLYQDVKKRECNVDTQGRDKTLDSIFRAQMSRPFFRGVAN